MTRKLLAVAFVAVVALGVGVAAVKNGSRERPIGWLDIVGPELGVLQGAAEIARHYPAYDIGPTPVREP